MIPARARCRTPCACSCCCSRTAPRYARRTALARRTAFRACARESKRSLLELACFWLHGVPQLIQNWPLESAGGEVLQACLGTLMGCRVAARRARTHTAVKRP
eukprot:6823965-Alexandrium_andersonii.AAC.1